MCCWLTHSVFGAECRSPDTDCVSPADSGLLSPGRIALLRVQWCGSAYQGAQLRMLMSNYCKTLHMSMYKCLKARTGHTRPPDRQTAQKGGQAMCLPPFWHHHRIGYRMLCCNRYCAATCDDNLARNATRQAHSMAATR